MKKRKKNQSAPFAATIYRDTNYGALAVVEDGSNIITIDHGFCEDDFDTALSVLEAHGGCHHRGDGGAAWHLRDHRAVAMSALADAFTGLGYTDDPLGERVIIREATRQQVAKPDLPSLASRFRVAETIERALCRHIDVAFAAMRPRGELSEADTTFLPRPNARDGFGNPLPFLRVRAFLRKPVEGADEAQAALREALAPIAGSLTRATVCEAEPGVYVVEVAVSPPLAVCETFLGAKLPTFGQSDIHGVRVARFVLNALVTADDVKGVEERAVACTAATGLAVPNGRTIVARIPATALGDSAADYGFGQRIAWLQEQLEAWEPTLDHIGGVEPIAIPICVGER